MNERVDDSSLRGLEVKSFISQKFLISPLLHSLSRERGWEAKEGGIDGFPCL